MKRIIKALFGLSFILGFLVWGFGVSAATIFTDNFNDYSNGALNGQGGWSAHPAYVVIDGLAREGAKSVFAFIFSNSAGAVKSGALVPDGQITVYVRRFDANQQGVFSFILREGTDAKIEVRGNFGFNGRFQYIDGSTGSYVNFGESFTYETWHAVQIQWRSSDHASRYAINNGPWTDWIPSIAPWASGLDTVELVTINSIVWDAIQERPIDATKNPVLIVPGLIGTELKNTDELLWADLDRMVTDIDDNFLDELLFNPELKSVNPNIALSNVIGFETLLGARVFDYTDGLVTELINQGYVENETIFTFPYDWRYGATGVYPNGKTNTDLLAKKITDILAETGVDTVDVIAHSMGGLIVKQYAIENPAFHHIGKAVFVGVPNTGAPKSVKTLLEGDNLGMFFVSQERIKEISENMPAIYDLLPSQQYYNAKGSYVKIIDYGLTGLFTTTKDLTYEETKNFLSVDHQLNSAALTNADNLHAETFDNFDLRTAGIDLYAIDGCKAGTLGKIIETRAKNIFGQTIIDYKTPQIIPGDGTVPLESATNLPLDQSHKFYSLTGEHSRLMSQDGSRQQIVNILAGSDLEVSGDLITQDINECQLNGKAISVFSPVDISVIDGHGNRLGLAEDGSIFNEIPNASFEMMGGHSFIYLPTDSGQTYEIALDGTGDGTFTIKSEEITNGTVTNTEIFSDVPVTETLTGQINLGATPGAADILIVRQNAESQPVVVQPSASFSTDNTPSEITIATPADGINYILRQSVAAEWSVVDAESGIESAVGTVPAGDLIDTLSVGIKEFKVVATNNAGNIVEKTVSYQVVYAFGGFSLPSVINKSDLKKMNTLPVKFKLADADGNSVRNAVATLTVNGNNAISSGGSNTGNTFRYDAINQQYIFNLSAKVLVAGKNTLVINLDDGTSHQGFITIK